jgi:hypothetical protein
MNVHKYVSTHYLHDLGAMWVVYYLLQNQPVLVYPQVWYAE